MAVPYKNALCSFLPRVVTILFSLGFHGLCVSFYFLTGKPTGWKRCTCAHCVARGRHEIWGAPARVVVSGVGARVGCGFFSLFLSLVYGKRGEGKKKESFQSRTTWGGTVTTHYPCRDWNLGPVPQSSGNNVVQRYTRKIKESRVRKHDRRARLLVGVISADRRHPNTVRHDSCAAEGSGNTRR